MSNQNLELQLIIRYECADPALHLQSPCWDNNKKNNIISMHLEVETTFQCSFCINDVSTWVCTGNLSVSRNVDVGTWFE